jgi:hypothetical protein
LKKSRQKKVAMMGKPDRRENRRNVPMDEGDHVGDLDEVPKRRNNSPSWWIGPIVGNCQNSGMEWKLIWDIQSRRRITLAL